MKEKSFFAIEGVPRTLVPRSPRPPCEAGPESPAFNHHQPFYRTISGVRLCWVLEEPKGPKARVALSVYGLGLKFQGARFKCWKIGEFRVWVLGVGVRV